MKLQCDFSMNPSSASHTLLPPRFQLQPGGVYRRKDLVAQGLYYAPIRTQFGGIPPKGEVLVAKFLDDSHFLILNPSYYDILRLGTTQLYNQTLVYNHERHGRYDSRGLRQALTNYGSAGTRRLVRDWFEGRTL
jgi:hypothetical protein